MTVEEIQAQLVPCLNCGGIPTVSKEYPPIPTIGQIFEIVCLDCYDGAPYYGGDEPDPPPRKRIHNYMWGYEEHVIENWNEWNTPEE